MLRRLQNIVTNPLGKRIYLNPDFAATPKIFEYTLRSLNGTGIPAEPKMLQRSHEIKEIQPSYARGRDVSVRCDGIVLYFENKYADQVLKST